MTPKEMKKRFWRHTKASWVSRRPPPDEFDALLTGRFIDDRRSGYQGTRQARLANCRPDTPEPN